MSQKKKNKKSKSKRGVPKTTKIRTAMAFLQFLETKIVGKDIYGLNRIDVREVKKFKEFIKRFITLNKVK